MKNKTKKNYDLTPEYFLGLFEHMNRKLNLKEKEFLFKYIAESPDLKKLSKRELKLIKQIRELQLELMDVVKCKNLRILV